MAHRFDPAILRDYDVRGVVGQTLTEADAVAIGRSFGTVVRRAGGSAVAVGYDGRLSSPMLEAALTKGLHASGVATARIGLGPSPMLYFAEQMLEVDGGVQVTGSHNPGDHNGFKLVLQHRPFFGDAIQQLGAMAAAGDWETGHGESRSADVMDAYVDRLMNGFVGDGWAIGWDAGNGAAGPVVEKLVKLIPGEHHLLFTKVDGHFPNHHPDPTIEANLADLQALVRDKSLDFGVAFDGDGDRIGVVDGTGRIIWGDQLLALLAEPVLKSRPGAPIIGDVKMSQATFDRIVALGGVPIMAKSGHSHIKSELVRTGAPLGGEMSGHIFFADDYYGYDDGLYAAIRLIRATATLGRSVTELRSAMPAMINTPELRFAVPRRRKFAVVAEVLARLKATGAQIDETDGARVTRRDGWWLLRASNTQDVLVARAEARSPARLKELVAEIDTQLRESGVIRHDSQWPGRRDPMSSDAKTR